MKVIETERLLLEPLSESCLEEFVSLTADAETLRYRSPLGAFPREVSESRFALSVERIREHGFGKRRVVSKESGSGLGFTDTKYLGWSCAEVSPGEVEIGWMLTRSMWGRGYGTEAGRAVRDEAFERRHLAGSTCG